MTILALETSCDETAAAVVSGEGDSVRILSHAVGSQIIVHKPYGGVIPELAARWHAEVIIPLVDDVLRKAFQKKSAYKNIDAIAVTYAPGLIVALRVGVDTAKALAFAWKKPIIGVNHLAGHIYSVLADEKIQSARIFDAPVLALIVSGGHTQLVRVDPPFTFTLVGQTRDDAAGEAFDKVAKMLGLAYPGGPSISAAAERGDPRAFNFPRPMIESKDFDFSFSGLKTHILYRTRQLQKENASAFLPQVPNIAASFQEAIVDTLVVKALQAAHAHHIKTVIVVGGVSANARLREKMTAVAKEEGIVCYFPPREVTCDNAAMIGIAGYMKWKHTQKYDDIFALTPSPKIQW